MTPTEQDVYALMGVSPLVLHSGEIKSPRNTVVAVAAPGQEPVLPPSISRSASIAVAESDFVAVPGPEPVEVEIPSEIEPETVPPLSTTEINLPVSEDTGTTQTDEANDSGASGLRRRRRRSNSGGAGQLTLETEVR